MPVFQVEILPPIQLPSTKSTILLVSRSLIIKALTQLRIIVDPQEPWFDSTGAIVYFFTPKLADGTHEIDITVNSANATEPFAIDYFLVTPNGSGSGSGVSTSRSIPSPTSTQSALPIITTTSAPVGAIVGGVVGGIAGIAILILALWYFLRKRSSGGRAYYFANPSPADMLAGEGSYSLQ